MNYPEGIDWVWLACDRAGRLGAMITAGMGPIPEGLLTVNFDPLDTEDMLLRLPVIAEALPIEDVSSSLELSRRGLFVYDWSDIHRTSAAAKHAYELVCSPSVPLCLKDLPTELQKFASQIDATFGSPFVNLCPGTTVVSAGTTAQGRPDKGSG